MSHRMAKGSRISKEPACPNVYWSGAIFHNGYADLLLWTLLVFIAQKIEGMWENLQERLVLLWIVHKLFR